MRALLLALVAACAHAPREPLSNVVVLPPKCRDIGKRPTVGDYRFVLTSSTASNLDFWLALARRDRDVFMLLDWSERAERCIAEGQ